MPPLYPVSLQVRDRRVVIVGAGLVALRRARSLLSAGAGVTVVAPRFQTGFDRLGVRRVKGRFRPAHLDGAALAYAATDSARVNAAVARAARSRGIPVNRADDPWGSDFHIPAVVRSGAVMVAISTGGASPALARRLRREICGILRRGFAALAGRIRKLRAKVLASGLPPGKRRALLRAAACAPVTRSGQPRRAARG
ncbi:MAG: bifunctional precorrin-2 dehydrogenase/sirohydrochlorin ferrochelatase [Planctomycetes bacterium]|nr:bifunctional precorrin-2 dehydrogenase/sirohydrochlorin ferrochelatase [Planctomycetota bacterium]